VGSDGLVIVSDRRPKRVRGGALPEIESPTSGNVWKIECQVGDRVDEGDTVAILESMKMEIPVEAEEPGTISQILCEEGQKVSEGDVLFVLE
jgi:acetyl-CoA carboxylase biotin carboxyl carrier protein